MSPALAPYWVMFYERDAPQRRLVARLGDTPPSPTGGGAGWEQVALPKRSAVTVWRGRSSLLAMDVPVVLGDADGSPVAPARTALTAMFRPANATIEPPVVRVRALGDAVPYQSLDFVVSDLAWSDMAGDQDGERVLQKLTVSLLEFREDEVLQQEKAAKPKHRGRSYIVRTGDTLTSIARRFKVKGGWRALGDAQHPPIHDPRKIRVGQRLLIP